MPIVLALPDGSCSVANDAAEAGFEAEAAADARNRVIDYLAARGVICARATTQRQDLP